VVIPCHEPLCIRTQNKVKQHLFDWFIFFVRKDMNVNKHYIPPNITLRTQIKVEEQRFYFVVLHSCCVLKCYAFSFKVHKLVPCYSKIIWSCTQYINMRPSWPWSYGSWIYKIRVRCTTLYDIVCQCLATGWWFSPGPPVSSTNKTDRHYITEILLKVALNTIKPTIQLCCYS
jgi:hypothetical protein